MHEARAVAQLLADAVRTYEHASALISAGRASEAAAAASKCLQTLSVRGDMQVTLCDLQM